MALKPRPSAGSYFKPESVKKDTLYVEVIKAERQVPGKYGPKDSVTVDIYAFDAAALRQKAPHGAFKGVVVNQTALARDLFDLAPGDGTIVTLGQAPTDKGNPVWVWQDPTDEAYDAIVDWLGERQAAEAEALAAVEDDLPDYLK